MTACQTDGNFTVEVRTIYAFSMPKKVIIQMKGVERVTVLTADAVERNGANWIVKNGANVIGTFAAAEVQGWYFEDSKK